MKRLTALGLFLVLFIIVSGALRNQPSLKRFDLGGYAQGTTWNLTYFAEDSIAIYDEIVSVLNRIDRSLSLYQPGSLVNRWNESKKGIRVDADFRRVTKKAIDVFYDTDGLFDMTVFPFTSAWGFGPKRAPGVPDSATIRSILPCVDTRLISIRCKKIKKKKACVQLDPNGIAQGYTVDQLAELLEKKGIRNYLVELGGEIRIRGRKFPSGDKMSIGIEAPTSDPFEPVLQKLVYMESGAITTSGNYRRYVETESNRFAHLIDPHTGFPIDNDLVSVTLIAPDAITADAYDNALMAMGLEKALNWIEDRPELAAFFIYHRDGEVRDTMSSRFVSYLKP